MEDRKDRHWRSLVKCDVESDTVKATFLQRQILICNQTLRWIVAHDLPGVPSWLEEQMSQAEQYMATASPWADPHLYTQMQATWYELDFIFGGRLMEEARKSSSKEHIDETLDE